MTVRAHSRFARWVPAPGLSALLLALWLVLNESVAAGTLLLGAALALAIPLAVAPLRPGAKRLHAPLTALRLFVRVIADVVKTHWQVARGVLRRAPPRSGFVVIPLDLHDPTALAVLAIIVCLTPDTLWAELSADHERLLMHVFDLHDEAAYVADVKARYEKPLMEIFR